MAFPESLKSKIVPALISFLETESLPYADGSLEGAITWSYNSNVHLPSMNPKGLVYLTNTSPKFSDTTGIIHEELTIRLRFLVSKQVDPNLRDAALTNDALVALDEALRLEIEEELINAEEFLVHEALYKVRRDGLSVTIGSKVKTVLRGHTISGSPQRVITTMDREGRSTGALLLDLLWFDGGALARPYTYRVG